MDVIVNNLTSTVELTAGETLDPALLKRIIRAVVMEIKTDETTRRWQAQNCEINTPGQVRG